MTDKPTTNYFSGAIIVTGCRAATPSLMARLVAWLGREVDSHDWNPYCKTNKHTIYYCRRCECGAEQVQHAGPMGDNKWHSIDESFQYEWERQKFNEAVEQPG